MQEVSRKRAFGIGWRARVPMLARLAAIALLASGIAFVGVSYYKLRNAERWKLKPGTPELSKDVTGVVEGYEQRLTKSNGSYMLVKASKDITFADSHHELENVSIALYPPTGDVPDQISALRAVYQPTTSLISFNGTVKIETKDRLKVNTESLSYDHDNERAQTDAPVTFERENVNGRAVGAVVEQKTKRLELKKDVELTVLPPVSRDPKVKVSSRARPVTVKAANGVFEQETLKLTFSGGVTAEQERDIMSGDALYTTLSKENRVEKAELRGNSYIRSMEPGRAVEARSTDMNLFFDSDQRLQSAQALTNVNARTLDADAEMQLNGTQNLEVKFQAQGDRSLLREINAGGRTTVTLSAPKSKANDPHSANKRVTADSLHLTWHLSGQDLENADAVGNAELFIEPIVKDARADRKTLTAPQMSCQFFEAGNLTKNCNASGGAKAILEPLQPTPRKGTRTLTAQTMNAVFLRETQDVEKLDASGDAKFNENDRNGIAANMTYTTANETVRFRGGEPTVWDSRGRTKGTELDSDLKNQVSYSRGRTSTTYYSQEQTGGATPFSKVKSPVYIVSDRAELYHESGLAVYIGNARAWQDDNFVRGDKLNIYVNDKRMEAIGHIQTAIYDSKRKVDGRVTSIPVFATADNMSYSDPERKIHYDGDVDIKQGTDRLTSGIADVFLAKDSNEMERTVAERNVVMTQPNRKGTGDWVQYTAVDEVAVLKGSPARVEDTEQGNTEGGRLTLSMRDSKVTADDTRGPLSPGRIRSTHKITKKP